MTNPDLEQLVEIMHEYTDYGEEAVLVPEFETLAQAILDAGYHRTSSPNR